MPGFLGALGMQAAQGALGGGMGLILGAIERRKQLEQQQKLQNMQIQGAQQMGIFNREQQMKLWEDTNYSAQMDQLKKAGLNPGLMYGHGGPGGSTNATPGAVSGAQAAAQGPAMGMGISMGSMQLQLLKAQKENIEADTNLKNTDATKKGGVETREAETRILDLTQGIQNKKIQEEMMQIQNSILSIEEHIKGKTQNTAISQAQTNLKQAEEELQAMHRENKIGNATIDSAIKQIRAEAVQAVLNNELTRENITLTKEQQTLVNRQIDNVINEIYNRNRHYNQGSSDEYIKLYEANQVEGLPKEIQGVVGGTWTLNSAGKQPAWLNYMTNVNRTYGNFAIEDNEMFMTLNRRYEADVNEIADLTTYIDPAKYNFIFAETALDAQNFWVQIGVDITARRKMSGKLMPNL